MLNLEYTHLSTIPKNEGRMIHKCKQCPYRTKSWFFIKSHVKRHLYKKTSTLFNCVNNLESFTCKDCNFSTYEAVSFIDHIKNHVIQREETENTAETKSKNLSNLLKENYESKAFIFTRKDLKNFEYSYKCDMSFCCVTCSYKSKWKCSVYRHYIHNHKRDEIEWFHCDKCSYKARSKYHLQRHATVKHKPVDWFYCYNCSFKCKQKHEIRAHIISEHISGDGVKKFRCDLCPYKTTSNCALQRHKIYRHTPPECVKWFHCDKCSYKAKGRRPLEIHIASQHIHSGKSR